MLSAPQPEDPILKNQDRLSLLRHFTPATPGKYECTMPTCGVRTKEDGFCPTHGIPLRLAKAKTH